MYARGKKSTRQYCTGQRDTGVLLLEKKIQNIFKPVVFNYFLLYNNVFGKRESFFVFEMLESCVQVEYILN